MTQALPEFGAAITELDALGTALGADRRVIADHPAPEVVSTALPQLMVPIRSRDALARLPSGGAGAALTELLRRYGTDCAMLYALAEGGAVTAHCRMFAPGLGVTEDPATGSAAGALGAHLVRRGVIRPNRGSAAMTFDQGLEIGRASRIRVTVSVDAAGAVTAVQVGGAAVRVIVGDVTL
jgi:trans-2,3-dihydro-3-hydroxyanthranilate isomerase